MVISAPMKADVAIVGAGPAGASLAIRLGEAGVTVRLLDRARFPRPKPCGEFVSPECLPLLNELGLASELSGAGGHPVRGMSLRGFGHGAEGRYGRRGRYAAGVAPHGYGLRRDRLDALLAERAGSTTGVALEEELRVTRLLRSEVSGAVTGVEGTDGAGRRRRLRASLVVGADGLGSRVAACLGVRRRRAWLRKVALTTRLSGVASRETGELHLFPGGYFAACTVDGGLFSVNLVVDAKAVAGGHSGLERVWQHRVSATPSMEARLAGAKRVEPLRACGPFATWTERRIFDGATLVGDAAGYIDPMTGEGISYALIGSRLLAGHIQSALSAGDIRASALGGYEREYRRALGPRHRTSLILQAGMRSAAVTRAAVLLLRTVPGLFDRIVESTGGAGWITAPADRSRSPRP